MLFDRICREGVFGKQGAFSKIIPVNKSYKLNVNKNKYKQSLVLNIKIIFFFIYHLALKYFSNTIAIQSKDLSRDQCVQRNKTKTKTKNCDIIDPSVRKGNKWIIYEYLNTIYCLQIFI